MSKRGMGKFLVGAGIGAAITALFTTEKGKEYQAKISSMCEEMIKKVRELDSNEVKENIENKIADIKNELADLDKEKVKEKAKKLAKDIEVKTKELAKYAKEKGTPVMEEMAENLRVEAVKATKAVLNKLEKSKKTKKEA
nr:YtxH domain-containing protein [Bacilli bacterium]